MRTAHQYAEEKLEMITLSQQLLKPHLPPLLLNRTLYKVIIYDIPDKTSMF